MIKYGQVTAFQKATTTPIAVKVKSHTFAAKQRVFTVTYQTSTNKSELSSIVTVTNKGEEDTAKKERISANDFNISVEQVKALTNHKSLH